MRVALLGGSFDPPHRGHVALARLARERLSLDRILVAPVAIQPLKQEMPPASFEDRVSMTRLAFADEPRTEVSLIDGSRPDGKSNYTVDTIAELRRQLNPADELFCIVGADSFLTIAKWHSAAALLTACDFIVGARPGVDLGRAEAALPGGISARALPTELAHMQVLELADQSSRSSRLYLLSDLAEDVSATEVRSALRGEANAIHVINPAVEQYVRAHGLYTHL